MCGKNILYYLFFVSSLQAMDTSKSAILHAIEQNNVSDLYAIITLGANLGECIGEFGYIDFALYKNNYNCALLLIQHDAPISLTTFTDFLCDIYIYSLSGDRIIMLLGEMLNQLKERNWPRDKSLNEAIENHRLDLALLFLRFGAQKKEEDQPLITLLNDTNKSLTQNVISSGVPLNPHTSFKLPLETIEDSETIQLLLRAGSSPNIKSHYIKNRRVKFFQEHDAYNLRLFLKYGAIFTPMKYPATDDYNSLVNIIVNLHKLIDAASKGDFCIVSNLLPSPETVTIQDMRVRRDNISIAILNTALLYATGQGYHPHAASIVARLLQYGASPYVKNNKDESALSVLDRIISRETYTEEYTTSQRASYETIMKLFLHDFLLLSRVYNYSELCDDVNLLILFHLFDIPESFKLRLRSGEQGTRCAEIFPSMLQQLLDSKKIMYYGNDEYVPEASSDFFHQVLKAISHGDIHRLRTSLRTSEHLIPLFVDETRQPFALVVAQEYAQHALTRSRQSRQAVIVDMIQDVLKGQINLQPHHPSV